MLLSISHAISISLSRPLFSSEPYRMTEKLPLVSVIIPTYNHAHFLGEALTSVINQTYPRWEVIVVNNFSSDNTKEVVSSFNETRIKIVDFANNGIIGAARNRGIKEASGTYVAFLDSDDLWYPEKLDKCVHLLEETGSDLVAHHLVKMKSKNKVGQLRAGPVSKFKYEKLLFTGNCLANSSVIVKRDSLLDVGLISESSELITVEDYDLWLRLSLHGLSLSVVDEMLGEYAVHESNNSSALGRHLDANLKLLKLHTEEMKTSFKYLKTRSRLANIYYSVAREATNQRKFSESLNYFLKVIFYWPFKVKAYAALLYMIYVRLRFS